MSRKKREAVELGLSATSQEVETITNQETTDHQTKMKTFWKSLSQGHRYLFIGILAFATLGVFGSGMKYLEERAKAEAEVAKEKGYLNQLPENQPSLASRLNPFTTTTTPSPTPQLSKEYIYAGSRMLAVEDANANAAPPADLAVWRPSNGYWYVMGGAAGSQQVFFPWGMDGDQPAQGDFDGDGKTDFAVFRPSSSTFWIYKSSDNSFYSIPFGTSGDQIAQADYDGDGKTDVGVFRSSNGTWYWLNSGSNLSFSQLQFGLGTDKPSPADYDGDGKADIGVWRNSDKTFYSTNSSNGQLSSAVINPPTNPTPDAESKPVSADYDGDGRADYAIRNNNNWIIRKSSNNDIDTIAWAGDKVVQNDYDGDGKVDIATWTNGTWSIKQSGNNTTRTEQWGMAGDEPVPAYYRR
jgi:hypothetical protein